MLKIQSRNWLGDEMVKVRFKRTLSASMKQTRIYVEDLLLIFENNECALDLDAGEEYEIYWRMSGSPGATLTIKAIYGKKTQTIVDKSKIASNRSRKSDFTYFKV